MSPVRRLIALAGLWLALLGAIPALAQATLIPPGEQCFTANTATSGGGAGIVTTLGAITPGSGYVSASYANVPLTGGSGSGATANITVTGGAVASVTLVNPGFHYVVGDNLSAANTNLGGSGSGFVIPVSIIQGTGTGMVGLLGPITGGTLYTTGTYGGVALTGGLGSGATANITVAGGAVTAVTILNPGIQYIVGDVLSAPAASIGGTGSGFSVSVSSITINNSLAAGTVGYYIPNTNTVKQTWQNAAQTILNTNPVRLDANGCATVYGSGIYRQILQDSLGNTVWDRATASTNQNNPFWAGQASGTANAITVADTSFSGVDGSIINFIPFLNNTSSATLNPSSFGNIPIVKDTSAGAVGLTGGEIVTTGVPNIVSVIYSATQANFHLLNNISTQPTAPLCGATGLKITNNGVVPNSIINLTADQILMVSAAGVAINRANVSLTAINITNGSVTSTANAMDGEAPGSSAWLDVFAIDNGTAPAGLVSVAAGSGLSPTLPSGYSYKCYLGAMRVDASGNLLRTFQLGNRTQYKPDGSANNLSYPVITSGAQGTLTNATFTPVAITASNVFVPPTATALAFLLVNQNNATPVALAPDANFAGWGNGSNPVPWVVLAAGQSMVGSFLLETTLVYYASAGGGQGIAEAVGWTDKVNAY